ncbi:MAG TPA: glycosyltransferase family 87 protein [Jatrophihabitantaceae bacterium]|jgi:hypothetical protein|nr:glycosyltransferase family 87 protein [Jatrophihabitantaceae bacterium]
MKRPLAAVLVMYLAVVATLLHIDLPHRDLYLLSISTVLFAAAVALLARSRLSSRGVGWLVLVVGSLLQLIALTRAPLTSDDANRYAWDAKVQLGGIDPYRYAPSAPQLAPLRDASMFGQSSACTYPIPGGCTAINRPDAHTIYPPVAQAAFDLGRIASFGGNGGLLVYQLMGALGAIAVTVLLLRRASSRGSPIWPVALWAWCPVVMLEFGNNAHIDWLAALLTVFALQLGARNRNAASGSVLGAAIAVKLYPALVLPALMRRRPWLVGTSAVATVVLVYLPHVVAVGRGVIGYLPGYLREDGYNSGRRLILVGTFLPHPADTVVALLVLAVAAWWTWRRSDPSAPEQTATIMTGIAFLVIAPSDGWYAAMLIALAIMSARYEWTILALAPSFVYLTSLALLSYTLAAIGTAVAWRLRKSCHPDPASTPQTSLIASAPAARLTLSTMRARERRAL